jgi:hypothetical protein
MRTLQPVQDRSCRRPRLLARLSCVWVCVVSGVLLLVPLGVASSVTSSEFDGGSTARVSLLESNGASVALLLGTLVAVAVAAVLTNGRLCRVFRFAGSVLFLASSVIGAASIGLFYLPPAITLALAGYLTPPDGRMETHPYR